MDLLPQFDSVVWVEAFELLVAGCELLNEGFNLLLLSLDFVVILALKPLKSCLLSAQFQPLRTCCVKFLEYGHV